MRIFLVVFYSSLAYASVALIPASLFGIVIFDASVIGLMLTLSH